MGETGNLGTSRSQFIDVSDIRVCGTCHEFTRFFNPRDDSHGDYFELERLLMTTTSIFWDGENPCPDRPSMEKRPGKGMTEVGAYSPWATTPANLERRGVFVPTISILPRLVLPCSANPRALQ